MDYPTSGSQPAPRVAGVRRIRAALVALGVGGALAVSGQFALAAAHSGTTGGTSSTGTSSTSSGLDNGTGSNAGLGLGVGSGTAHATTSGS
jgi:hypothetical protein